jgi:hypothetical protein
MLCLLISASFTAGCASTPRPSMAETTAAEHAAKERYWAIQEKHRPISAPDEFETLPLARPARTEGGVRYEAAVDYLRIPRSP